jgi:catechol 2,3-dioxygenase-like lactoylglutathione lyase family enzyme
MEIPMNSTGIPGLSHVDHVALTVPDLNAAVAFYCQVIGAVELCRVGPFDASTLPRMPDGRDWTEAYLGVAGARLTLAMLQIGSNLILELFQYDKPEDKRMSPPRNCDRGGHHLALKVANIEEAVSYLRGKGVRMMEGPVTIESGPTAGLKWIYFLDPWGNQLELFEYKQLPFEASAPVKIYRPPAS